MARRNLLHKKKLGEFKAYLIGRGFELLDPKGDFEVLRWKGRKGKQMPIIYDRHGGDHLICNDESLRLVREWIDEKKAQLSESVDFKSEYDCKF